MTWKAAINYTQMAAQYGDMLCHEVDLVGTSSELDNDEEEDDEDDDDEEEGDDEDAEDDDFYDEEDSNLDDDFEGLSMNEEAEIMRYALAASHHDLQQAYGNNHHQQQQPQHLHHQHSGCGEVNNNTNNNNNYDLGTFPNHGGGSSCSDSNANLSIYNSTEKLIMETSLFDTKMRLIGNGIVLMVTTFALLVLQPLYFQQMTTKGPQFNVFGATLVVSVATALVFLLITVALGVAIKWKVPFYRPPLPWTK